MDKLRCPLLLIHGARDRHAQTAALEGLKAEAAGETDLWVVPRAQHVEAIDVARQEYGLRLGRFFGRHLMPSQEARPVTRQPSTPAPYARSRMAAAPVRR
jgi:dipeptidyl aminopeptidase/acylaminoacyl peptidase